MNHAETLCRDRFVVLPQIELALHNSAANSLKVPSRGDLTSWDQGFHVAGTIQRTTCPPCDMLCCPAGSVLMLVANLPL